MENVMAKVILDISMSLDGYVTAAGQTAEEPVGPGGEVLHDWAFGEDERGRQVLEDGVAGLGAVVTGRTTYDTSLPWWGPNGPSGSARRPVFVVTHQAPAEGPEDGVYTFVTDGIESALKQARAAAGEQDVCVMGGANVAQQYVAAGLLDEISIHLVPVLFGGGTRLFEHLGDEHIRLEPVATVETPPAVHLRFRVLR
jgi:dihydrofolate reductase